MVSFIGLRQRQGVWYLVTQTEAQGAFDWKAMRKELRDITGPSLYEDRAAVFERDQLLALAQDNSARHWFKCQGREAEQIVVIWGENMEKRVERLTPAH